MRESRIVGATLPQLTCLLGRCGIETVEERPVESEGEVQGVILLQRCDAATELEGGGTA